MFWSWFLNKNSTLKSNNETLKSNNETLKSDMEIIKSNNETLKSNNKNSNLILSHDYFYDNELVYINAKYYNFKPEHYIEAFSKNYKYLLRYYNKEGFIFLNNINRIEFYKLAIKYNNNDVAKEILNNMSVKEKDEISKYNIIEVKNDNLDMIKFVLTQLYLLKSEEEIKNLIYEINDNDLSFKILCQISHALKIRYNTEYLYKIEYPTKFDKNLKSETDFNYVGFILNTKFETLINYYIVKEKFEIANFLIEFKITNKIN